MAELKKLGEMTVGMARRCLQACRRRFQKGQVAGGFRVTTTQSPDCRTGS